MTDRAGCSTTPAKNTRRTATDSGAWGRLIRVSNLSTPLEETVRTSITGAMISAVTVGVVGSGALLVPAAADSGDGLLGCNTYEICFSRDLSNTTYQKHFYYGGVHDGYSFTNVNTGATGQGALKDNAAQVRNRDGSCDVKVIDYNGALPSASHTIANNNTWTNLKDGVRDQNNEHQRVNC